MQARDKALIWLRAESRPGECRSPLTPEAAGRLLGAGHHVVIEHSGQRCFDDAEYLSMGCQLAPTASWPEAPDSAFILGLKELPETPEALTHRHIYFGHAYKQQPGAARLLERFRRGGGSLLDLEFLRDEQGRRIAAFGYWAGFVGAALAVMAWAGQQTDRLPVLPALQPWRDRASLLDALQRSLDRHAGPLPTALVMGAAGRCGSGARALLESLHLPTTGWDIEETRQGGPFAAILDHDLFINCVLLHQPMPPFLTPDLLQDSERVLQVISDVSCDPGSPHNPLPVYDDITRLDSPARRLHFPGPPLDLVAIDHLPSLLPLESSSDFSTQLLPELLDLVADPEGRWRRLHTLYEQHSQAGEDH